MRGAENVYWLFSAAAQTIAAFVAFLLAGYALVQNMMDSAAAADETLLEIHESLKQRYHGQLKLQAALTALAVLSALAVVYFNAFDSVFIVALGWLSAGLCAAVVIGGVAFVVSIVDPRKYSKAAQRLARESGPSPTAVMEPSATFFVGFVNLEKRIRELWDRIGAERSRRRLGPPSFREMLEGLRAAGVITSDLYERLALVNRHRNLLFHGHVQTVSQGVLQELQGAIQQVAEINWPASQVPESTAAEMS